MNRPLRRLAGAIFGLFALLVGAATYFQVIAGPRYRDDPRNVRVAADRAGRDRGGIITGDGVIVARSTTDPGDPRVHVRTYPAGALYSHVVGYSTVLFGSTRLEQARAADLESRTSATISGVLTALTGGDLRPRGLRLTIDHSVQEAAREALGSSRGAVVAIDPATGAVLAMVSTPDFDPNLLIGLGAGPAGAALEDDPNEPLRNRATSGSYPPGSTFKIVTAAAALEAGLAGPETVFADPAALALPGSTATISNFDGLVCVDGISVTLVQAFSRSCNTTFGALGLDLGAENLVAAAERFGFNDDIPFDLDVVRSTIPAAAEFADDLPGVAQSAIGQRDVRATPLQMALVAAAVAGGGQIMVPYLVAEVFNADAEVLERAEPEVWRRALSPATALTLTDMMERVVTSGTGRRASVPGVRIAGKTGTAERPGGDPDLWFLGFGPVVPEPGQTQIALAVVVEAGGELGESATGGAVAAPIARAVFQAWLGLPG